MKQALRPIEWLCASSMSSYLWCPLKMLCLKTSRSSLAIIILNKDNYKLCFVLSSLYLPSQFFLNLKPRWQQRKILTWFTRLQRVQFCINHSRNYRANSIKSSGKNQSILILPVYLTSAFNFSSVAASSLIFFRKSCFHSHLTCQLRVEGRKTPRLQFLKHTHLSGSRVGFLYWQHVSREREQQNERRYKAGARERKRYASSASTLSSAFVWSEDLWSAVWFSLP